MKIGNLILDNPFFLAPMEAVNCASFRLLCKQRGAGLVFTDMIDADIFRATADTKGVKNAIKQLVNPQREERPLAIQLGGANIENLKFAIQHLEPVADVIDYNVGCPLGYMLGKKGGVYLMKHPDQLYKRIEEMRACIKKPFTVKIRSGWDALSINAIEVAKALEKLGVDAVTLHPRTRKQKYEDKADWMLAKKVKEAITIPFILSGDVTNVYMAHRAVQHVKCDAMMIGRGAKNNPSIFTKLKEYALKKEEPKKPQTHYDKSEKEVRTDFKTFLALYKKIENRYAFSELQDHALWLARECKYSSSVKQKLLRAKTEKELVSIMKNIAF